MTNHDVTLIGIQEWRGGRHNVRAGGRPNSQSAPGAVADTDPIECLAHLQNTVTYYRAWKSKHQYDIVDYSKLE